MNVRKDLKIKCHAETGENDFALFTYYMCAGGPFLEISIRDGNSESDFEGTEFDALKLFKFLADEFGFRTTE